MPASRIFPAMRPIRPLPPVLAADAEPLKGTAPPQNPMATIDQLMEERRKKLQALRDAGINPYPYAFNATHQAGRILEQFDELCSTVGSLRVAGRLVSLRRMGKIGFAHLQDSTGKVQLFFQVDTLGKGYALLQHLDVA